MVCHQMIQKIQINFFSKRQKTHHKVTIVTIVTLQKQTFF